jgi:hypothetical protein
MIYDLRMNANLYELKNTFMKTNIFRKINLPLLGRGLGGGLLPLFGRGLGGGLLLLIAAPVFAQYNLTLCEGQSFMLTSDAAGHPDLGQLTYTWKEGVPPQAPGTVTAVPTLTVTGKAAGTYAYVCEVANAACTLLTSSYTVEVAAVPVISVSGGNASQTVTMPMAVSPITYTASNATSIFLSSGSLPPGVSGTPSGASFTISGTPSATGTYNYSVSASNAQDCHSAAYNGTLTIEPPCTYSLRNNCCSGVAESTLLFTDPAKNWILYTWYEAQQLCATFCGGMRLPTPDELVCLYTNSSCSGHTPMAQTWTNQEIDADTATAILANLTETRNKTTQPAYVLCVR